MNYSSDQVISFNNLALHKGNYFYNEGYYTTIENNNMPAAYYGYPATNNINNNNYWPGGGMYDNHPFYINPKYISSTDLHATNPQLNGKGIFYPTVSYDIDSLLRLNPPAIGANEICISTDTVKAFCGDSIILEFCNSPFSGYFTWKPATGLNDIHLATPTLTVTTNGWYIILDSVSGYTDSVFIKKIAFNVVIGPDDSIKCRGSTVLTATYNAGAVYQ